jgi:hypothetical protein
MQTIMSLASWSLVVGVLTALTANGAIRPELVSPIAIDRISDTEFYILSSDGTVRRVRNSGGTFQQSSKFAIQGFPIDFTYSVSDQIASLFVCSTLAGKGVLSRYATDGSLMKRWWLWHTCGGVDFDPENHALYAATTDTHEIYRLDIRRGGDPEFVGELPGTGKIGWSLLEADIPAEGRHASLLHLSAPSAWRPVLLRLRPGTFPNAGREALPPSKLRLTAMRLHLRR